MKSPSAIVLPLPAISVFTASCFDGSPEPLATVGFSPNFAPAVMAGSGPSTIFGGGAADVADADGDGLSLALLESDLLSSPHPASVTSPAGTAMRRERRRTVGASYRSILLTGVRATLRREKGAALETYGARVALRPTDRNASLTFRR